jgi:integrase
MRVFKTTYKDRKGRTKEAAKWYIEFTDHRETVRRLPAFTSKAASEEMGRNLVRLVSYSKATGGQVDPSLTIWLAGLPGITREKLASIGLLDSQRAGASKLLTDHIADFARSLLGKGDEKRHVKLVTGRVSKVMEGTGARYYSDICASKVSDFLQQIRRDREGKRGISAQTYNFYISHLKQFCRWMMKEKRATDNPVGHLDRLNVQLDRRHDRRALSPDDLRRLIQMTDNGPLWGDMTGCARALLYRLACETGLRAGELRSLTKASFHLAGQRPTVTVEAAYSKRRRKDVLPLRAELAEDLQKIMATLTPQTPVFNLPREDAIIDMLRADLDRAGIDYIDEAGLFADFHALRHSFITNLVLGGASPKTAQELARHSTITLTMDRYTHTYRGDLADALNVLPDLSSVSGQKLRATGTENSKPDDSVLASCLLFSDRLEGTSGGANRRNNESSGEKNTRKLQGNMQFPQQNEDYARRDSNPQPTVPKGVQKIG